MDTEVEPVLAYQLNIIDALDSSKGLVKAGKTLAEVGRWAVTGRDKVESRSMKTMERASKLLAQALWRGMNFHSATEVSASKLLEAQKLVRAHLIVTWRREKIAKELNGKGYIVKEISLLQLHPARPGSPAEESGMEVGRFMNSVWRLRRPRFSRHMP